MDEVRTLFADQAREAPDRNRCLHRIAAGDRQRRMARAGGRGLFPVGLFPVLFAVPRMSGWLAQWQEMLEDPEQKIARPKQLYLGYDERPVPAG